MPTFYGDKVGQRPTSQSVPLISTAYQGGGDVCFVRDHWNGDAAQNDLISLGKLPSDAVINPVTSIIWFDDMGTSITMDVGSAATEDALVAAQDVATAAGSCSVLKSVDIANYFKPLWQILGLSSDPGGTIELFAKLEGGNPAAGDISWQIMGRRLLA